MGGVGSDIAVDVVDIALVDDEVKELLHLFALSNRVMITIKCNLSFSMELNLLAIMLEITGSLNLVVEALVHNVGSVLVIYKFGIAVEIEEEKMIYITAPWETRPFCFSD